MKTYTVRFYQKTDSELWNAFIEKAKNATFLLNRNFMDYHSNRFTDFSLVIESKSKWQAILPLNIVDQTVFSHQGVSYGGLVYDEKLKLNVVLEIFRNILIFLEQNKIATLQLKLVPNYYTIFASEEINYALFLTGAKLFQRNATAIIDLQKEFTISKGRMEGVDKGIKANLIIKEESNFNSFWNIILIPNLEENHGVKPVHSVEEIHNLKQRFPTNMRHFNVYHNEKIVAGATIFETKYVAHAQYIAGNSEKGNLGSIDFLFHHLITAVFKNKRYFDFGTSNEECGKKLNQGLSFWKESFGANIAVHDSYEVETANHRLLENVLI